ncbi:hypothetical protein ACFLUV_02575 [Elusimicrobiota bacterium]
MDIEIDQSLNIVMNSAVKTCMKTQDCSMHIFGDIDGIYNNGAICDPEAAIEKLAGAAENAGEFKKLMVNSVGTFICAIERGTVVEIYASPRGPGFFFSKLNGKLIVIDNEKEFFKKVKSKGLNDFEILHYMLNKPSFRSPFTTVFNDTFRATGGQLLEINKDLRCKRSFYLPVKEYCTSKEALPDLLGEFKTRLEELTKNAFQRHKRTKNYVQISGGIDSCAVLIAAKQCGLDITALHAKKGDLLTKTVELLCQKVGVPIEYCMPYYDSDRKKWWEQYSGHFKAFFGSGLGITGLRNMYFSPQYTDEDTLSIGGHAIGVLYQGHPSMFPAFGAAGFRIAAKDLLQHKHKRLLYTDMWRKLTKSGILNIAAPVFSAKDCIIPVNSYDYLLTLAITNMFPFRNRHLLPEGLGHLEPDYINYRSEVTVKPLMEEEEYNRFRSDKDIDIKYLAQLTRLLRFSTNVQGVSLNTVNYGLAGGFTQIDPPIQGPMIDFLHRLPIGIREVFNPKGLEFLYFKDVLKYDYYKGFIKDIRRLKISSPGRSFKREDIITSPEFKADYMPFIDPEGSIVIDMVKNREVRDYLYGVYSDAASVRCISPGIINQILNIEILFKEIL